jgi:hypothetical protein
MDAKSSPFTEFHIPVRQIDKVLPAIVNVQADVDVDKGTPFWPPGLAN